MKPRVVVTITQIDGTVIDRFLVEPMDKHLAENPTLGPVQLTCMVSDVIQNRFEVIEE